MPSLVTTLRSLLAQADAHFEHGRIAQARTAFEELLERSQERADHGMEVTARAMLAHVHLRRRDPDAARTQVQLAGQLLDPLHMESHGRYRAVLARLAIAEASPEIVDQELLAYLHWAEEAAAWPQATDAALLLAERGPDKERWLQRAIDMAQENGVEARLAEAFTALGSLLDVDGRHEEAFEAWQQAHAYQLRFGTPRQIVATAWAVGSVACRLEDWPTALALLDEAVSGAEGAEEGCDDLLALALADLAQVYEAAGDVIEARRLLLRAAALARQQDLPRFWPDRWHNLLEHGRRLELDL